MIFLTNQTGGSKKWWGISVLHQYERVDSCVGWKTSWGRIGNKGQSKEQFKEGWAHHTVMSGMVSEIDKKLSKGYRFIDYGTWSEDDHVIMTFLQGKWSHLFTDAMKEFIQGKRPHHNGGSPTEKELSLEEKIEKSEYEQFDDMFD